MTRFFLKSCGLMITVILSFIFCFLPGSSGENAKEECFQVKRIGQMVGYAANALEVTAPEDGVLSMSVRDDEHLYRVIQYKIQKGISQVFWDGCAYNSERMDTKYYNFEFDLSGTSGKTYHYAFRSGLTGNNQHLQFALPSSDTVWLSEADQWFVEAKAINAGTLVMDFIHQEDPNTVYSFQKPIHIGRVEHYSFDRIVGKSVPVPGVYQVKMYEISLPEEAVFFILTVKEGKPDKETVTVTGDIFPEKHLNPEEYRTEFDKEIVVVDIDYQKTQAVFSEPDSKSVRLGTLHGQTQGVSVFEIRDSWAKIGAWNHEDGSYIMGWVPYSKLKVVRPNGEYGLLLDKKNQMLYVFRNGEILESLLVSTGKMDTGKYFRETSAGCFVTGLHRVDFSMQGQRYDFVIQYDGGNLLHQIPYSSNGKKDFTYGRCYLGSKASHACIRIQQEPGKQSGINAYWIWTHIPFHTKLIILDDPEERTNEKAILSGNTPADNADKNLEKFSASGKGASESSVIITFGGDVVPGGPEEFYYGDRNFMTTVSANGLSYPFAEMKEVFGSDDLTCINLDCVLKSDRYPENYRKKNRLRGLPEYAGIFSEGSVEMVSLANDHSYDYQEEGYLSTQTALTENGIGWIGEDHSVILSIKGCLFGFGACTQENYLQNPDIIQQEIEKLKQSGCTYIIFQCHWGDDKSPYHNGIQQAMARACERAGADLVIGHHPSAVQGIDFINDMPVVFSLGKLISGDSIRPKSYETLVVQAFFDPDEKNTVKIRLIPVIMSSSAALKINDFKPIPANSTEKQPVIDMIQKDSACDVSIFSGNQ